MGKILIGEIINVHGIKGGLKVRHLTDDLERFYDLDDLYIEDPKTKEMQLFQIERVQLHKGFIILYLKGYGNINEVEHFKNRHLYIDKSQRKTLEEDTYFIQDLIGLEVESEKEGSLGVLEDVIQAGPSEVYVVRGEEYGEIMIPAAKEFIKEVDLEKGKMKVELIEGMLP
ncbi:ribosome maturation factor RimM [Isachenkonia alkalipeptolytica]|uniref:Ribosome maturation factor RimM n=1 Tax=Isachenkonia alkalipeptolytica TaxID=2565777 RepID=A0AA43XQA8_9CLOT|nr:ribosome maturation factor RimM [Isachenkonia alkalipeptolytica]NBG89690.1 16S rRNA processing protein RimM [Isachenkonia alkalipeptolytica]